jgi:hypothetical protein
MDDTLWNAFAVEVLVLFDEVDVLDEDGPRDPTVNEF